MEQTITKAIFAFALSFALIKILKPVSRKIGLIDKPNERKIHQNAVPLIGGLVIYLTLLCVGLLFFADTVEIRAYYVAAGLLTCVGVIDDRFDLSVRVRVLCSFIATGIMMYWGGLIFSNLGNLLGLGDITMPLLIAVPFTLIMMICYCSQATSLRGPRFEPVTGLFFVGLPLIDMVCTVLRRFRKGKSPFKPDRTHAHHIFLHSGFSPRQTLVILLCIAALINGMGIALHYLATPAWLQFVLFLLLFSFYYQGIQHAFRLSHLLQKVHGERVIL